MAPVLWYRTTFFYQTEEWKKECYNYIISTIPGVAIRRIDKSLNLTRIYFANGDEYSFAYVGEGYAPLKGHRCDKAVVEKGIPQDVIDNVIKPRIRDYSLQESSLEEVKIL